MFEVGKCGFHAGSLAFPRKRIRDVELIHGHVLCERLGCYLDFLCGNLAQPSNRPSYAPHQVPPRRPLLPLRIPLARLRSPIRFNSAPPARLHRVRLHIHPKATRSSMAPMDQHPLHAHQSTPTPTPTLTLTPASQHVTPPPRPAATGPPRSTPQPPLSAQASPPPTGIAPCDRFRADASPRSSATQDRSATAPSQPPPRSPTSAPATSPKASHSPRPPHAAR